ncbi:MAG: class I SAM-dependent methyltransferase [Deltaproteobacteria bacterium]|nr:class I SAM-dependent methyltransferase [Deltaproteobacteria bacterium]
MSKRRKEPQNRLTGKAAKADKYALYQDAVQCPEAEIEFFDRAYRENYASEPKILREDFCGAGAVSCQWVKTGDTRKAYGIDLDPEPLAWGMAHNVSTLSTEQRERLKFIEGNVLSAKSPKADVLAAQNFSFFIFKTREEVVDYFRKAHANIAAKGVMVIDMFGGSESYLEDHLERRKYDGFKYVWEQARFDPVTHHCTFYIHFTFKDGSKLDKAFRYDWRLWSIPEVREMLAEAGFSRSDVYWEGTDDDGEGNGEYELVESAPSDPAWVAYIVGVK